MSKLRLLILLASLMSSATCSAEAEVGPSEPEVAADLVSLTSCTAPGQNESYRVVVFTRGFEHVSSEVHLQWIKWQEEGPQVAKSVLVAELSSGMWSVDSASEIPGKTCSIELSATHTYSAESARFVVRPLSPGEYSIRNSASGRSGK